MGDGARDDARDEATIALARAPSVDKALCFRGWRALKVAVMLAVEAVAS